MLKILTVFGTRPEVIKMAPVVREMAKYADKLSCSVCLSGQHRQMTEPLLELFGIKADYNLDLMTCNQTLEHIVTSVLAKMNEMIEKDRPDLVMVQGDTSTAMAAALSAFYHKIRIAHIEAGLRTWNRSHPYPEEANRRIIDSISDLYFAHTESAKNNLLMEHVPEQDIEVTGNTVIDALLDIAGRDYDFNDPALKDICDDNRGIILVTAHRRESFGETFRGMCEALRDIALGFPQMKIVYPVHLNPNVQIPVRSILGDVKNIVLTPPLDYLPFVHLMKKSYFILTDSGGIQEEAPSLGVPVLVMRSTSERLEAVQAGAVEIIGTSRQRIMDAVSCLINDQDKRARMSRVQNPYGDGRAAQRIARRLLQEADKI